MKNLLDIYLDLLSKWKEFYKQYGWPYIAETAVLYDCIESFHPRLEAEMPINGNLEVCFELIASSICLRIRYQDIDAFRFLISSYYYFYLEQDPKNMIESIKMNENNLMPRVPGISSKNYNTDEYWVCPKDRKGKLIDSVVKLQFIKLITKTLLAL